MGVYAHYFVQCDGGGYLVPGQPMICHGVSAKFPSANAAHRAALRVGWTSGKDGRTHQCPKHQQKEG